MTCLLGKDKGLVIDVSTDIMDGNRQVITLPFAIVALIHLRTMEFSIPSLILTSHSFIISILFGN
jgi:hypothetical protein